MKLLTSDGAVHEGATAAEVVLAMAARPFVPEGLGLRGYADFVVGNALRAGLVLDVAGETDEEVAESFLAELKRAGLAEELPHLRLAR